MKSEVTVIYTVNDASTGEKYEVQEPQLVYEALNPGDHLFMFDLRKKFEVVKKDYVDKVFSDESWAVLRVTESTAPQDDTLKRMIERASQQRS